MSSRNTPFAWLWKLAICTIAYAVGALLGGILMTALALEMPRYPGGFDQGLQALLLFAGGLVYSVGLSAMAIGLVGRWWQRWLILATFLFAINGIGNTIEASVFTNLGGHVGQAVGFLLPSVACAFAVTMLFPAPSGARLAEKSAEFFARWKPLSLGGRVVLAVLAFPVIYFVFGTAISPIAVPYYEELEFLKIPAMSTLIPILHLRSTLLLLVSLPIIIGWDGSRSKLILGLALGHAAAVGVGGLVQVTFLPEVLRWVHGIEIFADSLVYAWILAVLFAAGTRKKSWPAEKPASSGIQ